MTRIVSLSERVYCDPVVTCKEPPENKGCGEMKICGFGAQFTIEKGLEAVSDCAPEEPVKLYCRYR